MSNDNRSTTIINYLFIFLTINNTIFVQFVTRFYGAGYALSALSIAVLLLNGKRFTNLQLKKPIIFWLFWCLYAFLNYYIHPHNIQPMTVFDLYGKIFIPLIVMVVVVLEYEQNANRLLWLCFITHAVYMLLGYYFDSGILNRIDEEENQLGNAYAINSSFTLFYLILLNRTKRINLVWFVILTVVIMMTLAMTGTRKAFGAGMVFLVFWLLSLLKLKKVGSWIIVVVFLWVGFWGYNQLMENTFMGQRMEYLEEQRENLLPPGAPEFLSVFGDRAGHYYYGWFLFLEHPLFGVGAGQAHVNQDFRTQLYTHTEYIAQLADQGIVGFLLFAVFYSWIIVNLFRRVLSDKEIGMCMFGGLAAILFLSLTAWTWEFPIYFICLGFLIGFCNTTDEQEEGVEDEEEDEELEIGV